MLKSIRAALAVGVMTLTAFGASSAIAEPLKVVASFTIIADFAKNVGGDRINLTTIVGPDGDARVYEPSPADAVAMAGADVVLVNGLHFEGFLQRLVDASATKATIAVLTKGVTPINFKPEFADAEAADALEGEVQTAIQSIPQEKRVVITSHDAFGYFEKAYGLTFLAPEGVSTESEPSAADVAKLVSQVKQDKAAAVFIENITNARLIEQIASETGIKVGGTLYSDALSQPDGPASTYIDLMRNNIAQIKGAILGS
ncbi:metal ABC transporter solute-binding protein, Zn/Mn family [Mesorhizobium ventifaucium]|uniref:Metal ABC transporter substrate-binding protein n=1 Tax=Mesorhizobium ventifaucium TaxID=666020 RepID=A0ABM9DS14_9HYPH|nr:zinc ABC transporter substrate-binding protein [Mesorhizobium ventifaucium]CAH2399477.1 Metal ABC transporter substrate-binding protein [Mesorhizobium ventifaucium]